MLVGGGDQLKEARANVSRVGLDDYIVFTGMIRDDDLILTYLSTADICVSPEPNNDLNDKCSFVKVVEYMAMGKPLVAFDMKETRFSAGDAALYAVPNDTSDFGDKMIELLDDPQRRARMSEIAIERSRSALSWEQSEVLLLAAYDALLDRWANPSPQHKARSPRN